MIDFIEGPMVWVAFVVFFVGLLFQVMQFFNLTRRKDPIFPLKAPEPKKKGLLESIRRSLPALSRTVWSTHPSVMVMTTIFHVCLIGTPLFVLGHNILLEESIGLGLWSFSERVTDVLTVVVFFCAAYFLARRIFLDRVRAISTFYDYVTLLITLAPFLTGYIAYHQWFHYETMIFLHLLSAEVMLIVIPFTKLGHMLFFFLYRFFIGSEYSFSQGTRAW